MEKERKDMKRSIYVQDEVWKNFRKQSIEKGVSASSRIETWIKKEVANAN